MHFRSNLGQNLKKVLSALIKCKVMQSASLANLSNLKFHVKQEKLWVWDQTCHIWLPLGQNSKKLLSYLKSTPSNSLKYKIPCETKKTLGLELKLSILVLLGQKIIIFQKRSGLHFDENPEVPLTLSFVDYVI